MTRTTPVAEGEIQVGLALAQALAAQGDVGLVFCDADLRVRESMLLPEHFRGLRVQVGTDLMRVIPRRDAESVSKRLQHVLSTGRPDVNVPQRMCVPDHPEATLVVQMSVLRLEENGLVIALVDSTEEARAQQQRDLLLAAAASLGTSLDIFKTAQQLCDLLVPGIADFVAVSVAEEIFQGLEPPQRTRGGELALRRAAVRGPDGWKWPNEYVLPGHVLPRFPDQEVINLYQKGEAFFVAGRSHITAVVGDDPYMVSCLVPVSDADPSGEALSVACAPLVTHRLLLGSLEAWRIGERAINEPFDDLPVLRELGVSTAVAIDNARRFTRERNANLALQRQLLPRASTNLPGAIAAGVYLPATSHGVGGDWYDVIPLPCMRVALVVGDVVGHGLRATATMARMRTAVLTLADQDMTPDELLTHLDDTVLRLADASAEAGSDDTIGSTCLYAVYDPVSRSCSMASAGHPPPAVVHADGTAEYIDVTPGTPLGLDVAPLPFEVTHVTLDEGDTLALYTDGLVDSTHDMAAGMTTFLRELGTISAEDGLSDAASRLVATLSTDSDRTDDVTLLLARMRGVPEDSTASWEVPPDPAAVAGARDHVTAQLAEWYPDDPEIGFVGELVVSELVTNAVRYASGGPSLLRLIRDRSSVICEVSDSNTTQPRIRRARETDEGGRGLYMIKQLAARMGTRYTAEGKTIWAELSIPSLTEQ